MCALIIKAASNNRYQLTSSLADSTSCKLLPLELTTRTTRCLSFGRLRSSTSSSLLRCFNLVTRDIAMINAYEEILFSGRITLQNKNFAPSCMIKLLKLPLKY